MTTRSTPEVVYARVLAAGLIADFGITSPEEIDVEALAMAQGIFVRDGRMNGAEAWLVRRGNKGIIRVRDDIPEVGRRRFAIGHELGHWHQHKGISQWAYCEEGDIGRYGGSVLEVEANAFASELLMPGVFFRPKCERATPDLGLIGRLAETFRTSLTATAMRFLDETSENCILVVSKDRVVEWFKRIDGRTRLWIEPRTALDHRSAAWDLSCESRPFEAMKRVPPAAWFKNAGEGTEVYEQSIRLGRYGSVLSLLWIIGEDEREREA